MSGERVSNIVTYTASGSAVIAGLTLNDWGVIVGMTIAVASFAYNVWHTSRLRAIAARRDDLEARCE